MIVVIGRVSVPAENRDALVAAAEKMQAASRDEKGCVRYEFYAAIADPLSFIAVEEWEDRAALDAHFAEPHLQEFSAALGELLEDSPEVAIHEIAGSSGYPG